MARRYAIYTGAGGHRFVANTKLGPLVAQASVNSGVSITRMYAGQDAAGKIHAVGLHTQAEVIVLHAQGVPGYGPANPVTKSTHCDFNDGIAYRWWPPGLRLPWWAEGIDTAVSGQGRFIVECRKLGLIVTVTYPGSVGEAQHVNLRKAPRIKLLPPLKEGSHGRRVKKLNTWLHVIRDPDGARYLPHIYKGGRGFGPDVDRAVRRFQRDHHLKADGVVGTHTRAQLAASYRYRKNHPFKAKKK